MTAEVPFVDPNLYTATAENECDYRILWVQVLAQLFRDARCYWRGSPSNNVELEQAFDDLVRCGPMTKHVCQWLVIEPEEVTKTFIRWCEGHTKVTRH